jgi:hypothetical protein
MTVFNNLESPEEFKLRLNSLTEKLNKINKNSGGEGAAGNQRIQSREA